MNFREKIDKLHQQIEEISTSEIIEMRLEIEKISGTYKYCRCPFHGGNIGSFVITDRMGIFKCFVCEAAGNGIKFIKLHDNITYLEAMNRIGLHFGLITQPISRHYKEEKETYVRTILKKKDSLIERRADSNTLNEVYRQLMQYTTLKPEHEKYLLGRGLTKTEIIMDEYFSIPSFKEVRNFISSLKDPQILRYIPGFYEENKRWKLAFKNGIAIPIKDSSGKINAIQIRVTQNSSSSIRYFWLSAASKGGVSAGSPVDVIYPNPQDKKVKSVCITEGKFKSRFLSRFGTSNNIASISVQGVASWKNAVLEIQEMDKTEETKKVGILFDADMMTKTEVLMQIHKLSTELLKINKKVIIYLWKEEDGKGIDDIIANNKQKEIKKKEIKKENIADINIFSDFLFEKTREET